MALEFSSEEELRQSFNTGDREKDSEVINAYLRGDVVIKQPEQQTAVVEQGSTEVVQPTEVNEEEIKQQEANEVARLLEEKRLAEEEAEKQRNYAALVEKQKAEEHERLLRELETINKQKEQERIAREETEKRLRMLEELKTQSTENVDVDSDEEYASEYTKQTRKKLDELIGQYGQDSVVVRQLKAELDRIKAEQERIEKEKRERELEQKMFDSINSLQNSYPELKTEKSVKELRDDERRFRKEIAMLVNAKSPLEVDRAVEEYLKGGAIKETAEKYAIRPPKEYDKYRTIVELIDMKNGIQYDPVTGKEIPILDEFGVQVRYRSLDEAYRIKTEADRIAKAKREAFTEAAKKIEQFRSSDNLGDRTNPVAVGLTEDQEREILAMKPEQWINDPEKKKLVDQVYAKYGIETPRYRGRKW